MASPGWDGDPKHSNHILWANAILVALALSEKYGTRYRVSRDPENPIWSWQVRPTQVKAR